MINGLFRHPVQARDRVDQDHYPACTQTMQTYLMMKVGR